MAVGLCCSGWALGWLHREQDPAPRCGAPRLPHCGSFSACLAGSTGSGRCGLSSYGRADSCGLGALGMRLPFPVGVVHAGLLASEVFESRDHTHVPTCERSPTPVLQSLCTQGRLTILQGSKNFIFHMDESFLQYISDQNHFAHTGPGGPLSWVLQFRELPGATSLMHYCFVASFCRVHARSKFLVFNIFL